MYIVIILAFDKSKIYVSLTHKIFKSLNANKAKVPNVIDCHLAYIINKDIFLKKYSKHAKAATVRTIFKKDFRIKIKKKLNIFSKIYERFLHENLTNYVDAFISKYISAYR